MQDGRVYPPWDELDLNERFAWETAGVAATEERRRRNVVITGCPGCGDGCGG